MDKNTFDNLEVDVHKIDNIACHCDPPQRSGNLNHNANHTQLRTNIYNVYFL